MARAFSLFLGVIIIFGVVFFLSNNTPTSKENEELVATSTEQVGVSVKEITFEEPIYFENSKGFYARPKDEYAYPGVLMIHEWWGLNDNIKEAAKNLAMEGYSVLAVDLFGKVAATSSEAQAQVAALDQKKALENLKAGLAFLRGAGAKKIASLGWCFGGGQSLQLSLSGENLDGTIIYYGNLITDKSKLTSIQWPVLGIFGESDRSIPTSTVNAFKDALSSLSIEHEINIYPGVGHAFANPSNPNYAPIETEDAWSKTLEFLKNNLKSETINSTGIMETQQGSFVNGAREFVMTSFVEMIDGKPAPRFSMKSIDVKKGEKIRIRVTNTAGDHNINLDEFNIHEETPLNEEAVIEFTADKTGDFEYYCSKTGHRASGHLGTLHITE